MNKKITSSYLKGEKIILREMKDNDAEIIVKWRNDPAIQKWMFNQNILTIDDHLYRFEQRQKRIDFVICEAEGGTSIGTLNFINIEEKRAEAGKMLGDKRFWRGGYAKEAFILWLNIAFHELGFEEVYVRTMTHNTSNIGLNYKLGFKEIERQTKKIKDREVDVVVMAIKKDDFQFSFSEKLS